MVARRLTPILPDLTLADALATTRIPRVAGLTGDRTALVTTRPCRAPHHAISDVGRIGGDRCQCPATCRWRTMACSFWTSYRRSAAMSWRCCVSRLRRVSYEYNLQSVINLSEIVGLANRLLTARSSGRVQ
jgi:hypothetical protein